MLIVELNIQLKGQYHDQHNITYLQLSRWHLLHGRTIRTAWLPGAPSLFSRAGEVLSDLPQQGKTQFFLSAVADFSFNWLTWAWASSFATQASRKFSQLPHWASGKKRLLTYPVREHY